MFFTREEPSQALKPFVKEYWIVEDESTVPVLQKIIPDGYCEIIFHYGDPYRIKLHGKWEMQSRVLFAGQISNHFYLENSGCSGIMGIKLQPAAFYNLSGTDMTTFTDRVVDLDPIMPEKFIKAPDGLADNKITVTERICLAEAWLAEIVQQPLYNSLKVREALDIIFEKNGMVDIEEIAGHLKQTRRHLEREFKKIVGLTPKFFSRIIRFNHIFQLMKERDSSWISIALDSGHFDQSHFIKNFKEFTGEEPSKYGFNDNNLANFFLNR
jgi:AraC-like DNA-binding protein